MKNTGFIEIGGTETRKHGGILTVLGIVSTVDHTRRKVPAPVRRKVGAVLRTQGQKTVRTLAEKRKEKRAQARGK